MYIRLSLENTAYKGKDSESIENQQALLTKFIGMMPGWVEKRTYIDNGASGGNFNRKGFQDMMADIRSGEINLVLVKDLSRFGRNYLEAGKYLEEVLPSLNCRFVALDDNIDTETGENDIMPFLNAMNDFYLKNLSDKVKSVLTAKAKNGQKIGKAPYGYRHNTQEHTVFVDEGAAAVVRRIYDMRLNGESSVKIAEMLNREGVPAPGSEFWRDCTILGILHNEFYAGHSVQNKRTSLSHRNRKAVFRPENEWIRVMDTHESIISPDIWNRVQAVNRQCEKPYEKRRKPEPGIFSGLLYCADCGTRLNSNCQTNKKSKIFWYYCGVSKSTGGVQCSPRGIGEVTLKSLILGHIKTQAELISIDKNAVLSKLKKSLIGTAKSRKSDSLKKQRELAGRLHSIETQLEKLYEDKVMKIISDDVFSMMSQKLESKRRDKEAQLDELTQAAAQLEKKFNDIDRWMRLIEEYAVTYDVDRNLLERLIDRIEIGRQDVVNGVKTQDDIHFIE